MAGGLGLCELACDVGAGEIRVDEDDLLAEAGEFAR
jgi:hypothetical protein